MYFFRQNLRKRISHSETKRNFRFSIWILPHRCVDRSVGINRGEIRSPPASNRISETIIVSKRTRNLAPEGPRNLLDSISRRSGYQLPAKYPWRHDAPRSGGSNPIRSSAHLATLPSPPPLLPLDPKGIGQIRFSFYIVPNHSE